MLRAPLLIAALASFVWASCDRASTDGDDRADAVNVLLITVDSLRADRLGSYGYTRPTSPELDALSAEGVRFERAYSHAPFTPPAHASLLTGLNVQSHGILGWADTLAPGALTLGERFSAAGWRTGAFYNHPALRQANVERGFDERQVRVFEEAEKTVAALETWLDAGQGAFCAWVHLWDVHRPYGWRDWRDENLRPPAEGSRLAVERESLTLAFAETPFGQLPERGERSVGREEAHYNLTPSERQRSLPVGDSGSARRRFTPADWSYIEDRYDSGVAYLDRALGELFDDLRERGLWDNTLVIVTADHGESLREREAVWFTHDPFVYEETLRVPLLIKFPTGRWGGLNSQADVTALVRGIDILPTILEVCDVRTQGNEQGVSLVGLLEGQREATGMLLAQTQTWNAKETEARIEPGSGWLEERYAVIAGSTKLIRDETADAWSLFDLDEDPRELRNLALDAGWRERRDELSDALQRLRGELPRPGATGTGSELSADVRNLLDQIGYF